MDTTQISRRQILVVGSCNTDMVIKAAHLPRPGETILGGTFFMNPGGKGANQAVAIARLGGSVLLYSYLPRGWDACRHRAGARRAGARQKAHRTGYEYGIFSDEDHCALNPDRS